MRKVLELKGFKSMRALNAYSALILGLKMLPAYMSESYESFLARVQSMNEADQEKLIREAVMFVELQPEEINSLVCFCTDKLGVPYTQENVKSLKPNELVDIIVAVCVEISKIKIDFVTEAEKKKLETSQ